MSASYLFGRAEPEAVAVALQAEFVFAHPEARLVLREGDRFVSPSVLRRRGAHRVLYRLACEREVPAAVAAGEGWIDGLADSPEEADRRVADPGLSLGARRAARRLLEVPALSAALALERAEFALMHAADDKEEGVAAFFEKRPPRFANR